MEFNKLVRDNIPSIIEAQGETPVTRILEEEEFLLALEQKLDEEVAEYHGSKSPEELADILEVLLALAKAGGCTEEELFSLCRDKRAARGGFSRRIFLLSKHGGKKEGDPP